MEKLEGHIFQRLTPWVRTKLPSMMIVVLASLARDIVPGGPELSGTSRTSRASRTGAGTTLSSRARFDFASDCVRRFIPSASKVVSFVPDVPGGSRAVVRDVRGSSRFVVRDVPGGCRLVVRDVPSCCRGFDSVIGQCRLALGLYSLESSKSIKNPSIFEGFLILFVTLKAFS